MSDTGKSLVAVQVSVMLPPELASWGKSQPGGLSHLTRLLLEAARRGEVCVQVVQVVPPVPSPDPVPPPVLPPTPGWTCVACGRVNRLWSAKTCRHCRTARA